MAAPAPNRTKKITVTFPMKGANYESPSVGQMDGTSPNLNNILPYDFFFGARRGAQRPGLVVYKSLAIVGGGPFPPLALDSAVGTNGTKYLAAAAGRRIFVGADDLTGGMVEVTAGNLWTVVSNAAPQFANMDGIFYLADGASGVYTVNPATSVVGTLAASVGSLPTTPSIVVNFRGRLCFSGVATDRQNIFMSRAGTPTDFDYGQVDQQAAVALNASTSAGRIGQPVVALMPFTADAMLIGCDKSLFLMKGDPAQGGSILTISDGVGVHTRDSWTVDQDGSVYFLGSNGFYRYSMDTGLTCLSCGRMDTWMAQWIKTHRVTMAWDRKRNGCYLFAVSYNSAVGVGTWYDKELDAFFPLSVPATFGPLSMIVYDPTSGATARSTIFGGRERVLYRFSDTAIDDNDGSATPVVATMELGPFAPSLPDEAKLTEVQLTLGPDNTGGTVDVNFKVNASNDPTTVDSVDMHTFTRRLQTGGRQPYIRHRVAGQWFYLTMTTAGGTGDTWSLESATLTFEGAGKSRGV